MPEREIYELDGCHDHGSDEDHGIPFWKRAPITVGQLAALQAEMKVMADTLRWIPIDEEKPRSREIVEVVYENDKKVRHMTLAEYVAPWTVEADGFLEEDYAEGAQVYHEERDIYYARDGFYEYQHMADIHWLLDEGVLFWRKPLAVPLQEEVME